MLSGDHRAITMTDDREKTREGIIAYKIASCCRSTASMPGDLHVIMHILLSRAEEE